MNYEAVSPTLDFQSMVARMHQWIEAYNENKPLSEQIRQPQIDTAKKVYDIFRHLFMNGEIEKGAYDFFDSGASIAAQCRIHPKTLDNHLRKLQQAEICWKEKKSTTYRKNTKSSLFRVNPDLVVIK